MEDERRRQQDGARVPTLKLRPITDKCHADHPGRGCAARSANHEVKYYNSGGFTYNCPYCNAKLLKSEYEECTRTIPAPKNSLCCSSKKAHVQKLMDLYDSMQNPIESIKVGPVVKRTNPYSQLSGASRQHQL
jgi:hypothetical protein